MQSKRHQRLELLLLAATATVRTRAGALKKLDGGNSSEQQIPLNGPKCVIKARGFNRKAGRWNQRGRVIVMAKSTEAAKCCRLLQILFVISALIIASFILSTSSALAQAALVAEDESSVVISSRQGQLFRGLKMGPDGERDDEPHDGQVVAFLGLRYASAPVKRLRFMPPTPFNYAPSRHLNATGDGGVKLDPSDQQLKSQAHDQRHFGPICMQHFPMELTRDQVQPNGPAATNNNLRSRQLQLGLMERLLAPTLTRSWRPLVRKLTSRFVQSEDCLNLNIYTPIEALKHAPATNWRQWQAANASNLLPHQSAGPEPPEPLRPVLVLIHGESFEFGAGSALGGRRFAQNNRQVVITLNYRLHILGSPPRFGPGSRSNLGLLDQVAALHWIQANVRSFGGSPTKITLLGAKGGAIFVHLLMLSPLARGLFQRAVLEDGTALSPTIGNNMASAPSIAPPAATRQLVNQHARLLAQLNDCPTPTGANSSTTTTTTSQDQELGLTIECLKSKPAELIMRHLPIELIDTNKLTLVSSNSIPLASKWLRPLEQTLELLVKEELKFRLDREESGETTTNETMLIASGERRHRMEQLKRVLTTGSNEQLPVLLDLQQLNWLIALMINKLLQLPTATTMFNSSSSNNQMEDQTKLAVLLTDILGAIYLPSNKTLPIGPPYAPQLEPGLILADSSHGQDQHHQPDLAGSMLQRNSHFARRDLLIGLTHSLIDSDDATNELDGLKPQWHHEGAVHLAPGLSSRRLLDLGLTEAEAIGQVNLFVHSFYRFHQQEISNSIISHYLSRKSGSGSSQATNLTMSQRPAMSLERLRKQQFLAGAMRELYQNSLIDIPLIKTALIHSLQQLETMADLFVSQQVVKLEETQRVSKHDHEELEQLVDERHLEEEFHNFARELYHNQARWPVRLLPAVSSNAQPSQSIPSATMIPIRSQDSVQFESSIQSTFLFQIGTRFSWLRQRLQAALERLSSGQSNELTNESTAAIKSVLVRFMEEISSEEFKRDATGNWFGCSFVDALEDDDEADSKEKSADEENANQEHSLWEQFRAWICRRRLERRLANFVETGNVNRGRDDANLQKRSRPDVDLLHRCSLSLVQKLDTSNLDQSHHHLVQLYDIVPNAKQNNNFEILVERSKTTTSLQLCRNQIEQVAFEELLDREQELGSETTSNWNVFNVFTQQLANLFAATTNDDPNWSLDSFISSPSALSTTTQLKREQFDEKIAFWANFIGALNCSRTQPIGAGSLSLFSQANSTLLNMNLNLNCQQQQQQHTANLAIQSIGRRIKHELGQQVALWRRHRTSKSRLGQLMANLSSNHHSLRMVNTSNNNNNNNHHQDQSPQQQQLEDGSQAELAIAVATEAPAGGGINLLTSWFRLDNGQAADKNFPNRQMTRPFVVFGSLGVLAAFVSISLFAGFMLVLKRHRNQQKRSQAGVKQDKKETDNETEPNRSNGLQLDAGQLFEQTDLEHLTSGPADYVERHDNQELSSGSPQYGNSHLLHYHLHETGGRRVLANEMDANGALELLAPSVDFVHHQHHHLVEYDQQQASDQMDSDCQIQNGNFAPISAGQIVDSSQSHRHLPTCNLMLLHQRHQNQPLLSSSSETTSTTNNQRAQSSVSLVSTLVATPTNETDRFHVAAAVSSGSSVGTKKRVKIRDPKQRPIGWFDDNQPIHLPNGPVLHLTNGNGGELHTWQLNQFCPIHRSSSNLNLMNQSTNGLDLVNGSNSLMRSNNNYASQKRAGQLENGHFQPVDGLQMEVCAAHNFHHQQQQVTTESENFYQTRRRVQTVDTVQSSGANRQLLGQQQ